MNRRRHWVVWVKHEADTGRKKRQVVRSEVVTPSHFRSGFRTQRALNNADVNARFFKHLTA